MSNEYVSFEKGRDRSSVLRNLSEMVLAGEVTIGNDGNEPDTGEFAVLNSPERPPESEGAQPPETTERRLGEMAISYS